MSESKNKKHYWTFRLGDKTYRFLAPTVQNDVLFPGWNNRISLPGGREVTITKVNASAMQVTVAQNSISKGKGHSEYTPPKYQAELAPE